MILSFIKKIYLTSIGRVRATEVLGKRNLGGRLDFQPGKNLQYLHATKRHLDRGGDEGAGKIQL